MAALTLQLEAFWQTMPIEVATLVAPTWQVGLPVVEAAHPAAWALLRTPCLQPSAWAWGCVERTNKEKGKADGDVGSAGHTDNGNQEQQGRVRPGSVSIQPGLTTSCTPPHWTNPDRRVQVYCTGSTPSKSYSLQSSHTKAEIIAAASCELSPL